MQGYQSSISDGREVSLRFCKRTHRFYANAVLQVKCYFCNKLADLAMRLLAEIYADNRRYGLSA